MSAAGDRRRHEAGHPLLAAVQEACPGVSFASLTGKRGTTLLLRRDNGDAVISLGLPCCDATNTYLSGLSFGELEP